MLFKSVLVALAVLTGASAQLEHPSNEFESISFGPKQRKSRGGLDLQGLLKLLDESDDASLRGMSSHRRLQTIVGPDGETMTKQEIQGYIKAAIDVSGDGKGPYANCEELFDAFDTNGDGLLTIDELAKFFQSLTGCTYAFGLRLGEALIDWYDLDGDGNLDPDELEAACKGDPHFVTWYGSHFSYHGACDLVLVNNPRFASGKGLDVHVRTAHMLKDHFSYVSNAAVRVGTDVLEVIDNGNHFVNGVLNSSMPARLGDFVVTKRNEQICRGNDGSKCYEIVDFKVALMERDEIQIKVASNMVHVDVKGSSHNFEGSSGLMGTYPSKHHGKIARDGLTFIREPDMFAQEWQVLESEAKLFQEPRFPQHPQACIPAVQAAQTERRLRDEAEGKARVAAEEACAHVEGRDWEFCVFDVMATGDYGMAATIYA